MRPQDEILVALPRQPPPGRRFLLRRLGELPSAPDLPILYQRVAGLEAQDPGLAAHLCEESLWEHRELERLRRSVGEESGSGGTWTSFLQPAIRPGRPEDIQDASVAAGSALEHLLEPLLAGAERGERELLWVTRALGRIRSKKALEALETVAFDHGGTPQVMAALATLGGELAAEKAVVLVSAVEGTAVHPQLLAGFAGLPTSITYQFLVEELKRSPVPAVAAGVASALEGFAAYDPLPVLDALLKTADPWVLINTVETLGRIGQPDYLQRIEKVFAQQKHPLIRVGCLQAISGSTGETVARLAAQGLASGEPNVQAAAIEAMVTAGVPYDRYREDVLRLLGAPHPKLALNCSLACVAVDPQRALQRVTGMLSSGVPAQLLQSIHTLAYIEAASSIQALTNIIQGCPPGAMRLEAVKSLGRLATRHGDAVEPLTRVLALDDGEARDLAIWFLANAHPAGRVTAAKALAGALRESPEHPMAVTCIEGLGLLGPAGQLSVPDLHHALLTGPAQADAAARALAVAFPRSKEAQDLLTHDAPAIQGYGGLMTWMDKGEGLDMLYQALSQRSPSVFRTACDMVRLAAAAGGWTTETRRLVGLAKALGAAAVDAKEAAGLGRLDQSLSLPRKKIGLGIVPKGTERTRNLQDADLQVRQESLQGAEQISTDELLNHSFYETASQPAVTPAGGASSEQNSLRPTMPSSEAALEPRPATAPAPPSPAGPPSSTRPAGPPSPRGPSKVVEAFKAVGVLVLCLGAVWLGRFLKTLVP